MHATYNPWLICLSVLVAVAVSYTALMLAGRVGDAERSDERMWLVGGATSMGIGIWSMHFIGMLAYTLPIPLRYNILVTLASLAIAILTSGFALSISSRRNLSLARLAVGSLVMGAGICAMHYTGMAAIQIQPTITYDPRMVAASVVIAVTAAFTSLWLFFRLRNIQGTALALARACSAVSMGGAIAGMHYTAMFAARVRPGAHSFGGAALDNAWLGATLGLLALGVLTITLIALVYDAHLESRSRRDAERLARLNEELQYGKNLLTLATQAAGIACWEFDPTTGSIVWMENEIASLASAPPAAGQNPNGLLAHLHPEDAAAARSAILEAVRSRRDTCALRLRFGTANRETIHLQTHARLLRDERGRLHHLLGVSWDISEQVEQEQRRLQLQLQLHHASHQAGMAEVATGVLHSIGNVLNSLGVASATLRSRLRASRVGNVQRVAQLLADQGPRLAQFLASDPRGRELPRYLTQLGEHLLTENRELAAEAQAVGTHVEHVATIVAAQQTHARRGGEPEELDVSELIEQAIVLHIPESAGLTVSRDYQAVGRIVHDRHKLLQILANLLSNARHALRARAEGPRRLSARLRPNAPGSFEIEIEDTGVGMDEQTSKRLFEFGFTTKQNGHGFGLHSSAILAKEMGGSLLAHSDGLDRGARFTLRLPNEMETIAQRKSA